jgi:hypothetical protein
MKSILNVLIVISLIFGQVRTSFGQQCGEHCYSEASSQYDYWDNYRYSEMSSYYYAQMANIIFMWTAHWWGGATYDWVSGADIFYQLWENPWDYIYGIENTYYNGWGQTTDNLNYCLSAAGC